MEIFSNIINFCGMRTLSVSSSFRKYANFEWSVLAARYKEGYILCFQRGRWVFRIGFVQGIKVFRIVHLLLQILV